MQTLNLSGETITIYKSCNAIVHNDTIVYLQTIQGNGQDVWQQCKALGAQNLTLVSVEVENWNDALTPWPCEGIFAEDKPFAGKAEQQLNTLEHVVSTAESHLEAKPSHRCIAGYSLAGLFAAWAPFKTDIFDASISASGSLWYPGFAEFVAENPLLSPLKGAYFSLGSKEAKTPSRLLRNVASGTQSVIESFKTKGVPAYFEKNPGNHFKEPDLRMAKGICWALENLPS